MKAMILAAGRGERLRPLTDSIPKPLVSVGEHSLIEYKILKLKAAGFKDIMINLSYRGDMIKETLGTGAQYGINLHYSHEGPEPLGTGGGVKRVIQFFAGQPFVIVSADIWSDYPYKNLLDKIDCDAYLVMVSNPDYHQSGDFGLDKNQITLESPYHTYANIGVYHPTLFHGFHEETFALGDVLRKAIGVADVQGELYQGFWCNVGTTADLEQLKQYLHSVNET